MVQELIYIFCIYAGPVKNVKDEMSYHFDILFMNGFQVVVKKVSSEEYSETNFKTKVSDIQWLDAQVREHVQVINAFMQFGTVIPFKFGTIYQSEINLTQFLDQYYLSLEEHLLYLEEMEEWSVKMYADVSILSEQIDQLSIAASELENQIQLSSPGKAFLLKKKKQVIVEEEIERISTQKAQFVLDELRIDSATYQLNVLQTKEITGRDDEMILNACFLIKRNEVPKFQKLIKQIQENISGEGFKNETSGPWPAFSFISIKENPHAS